MFPHRVDCHSFQPPLTQFPGHCVILPLVFEISSPECEFIAKLHFIPAMTRSGNSALTVWSAARNYRFPVFTILLVLIITVVLLFTKSGSEFPIIPVRDGRIHDHNVSEILDSAAWPNPTVEFINGTESIWQVPPNPKAVLFVAHGCGVSPHFFWPKCPGCDNCIGFPEESRFLHNALLQSYAVVVIKSTDTCWSDEGDTLKVKEILRLWIAKNDFVKLPLVGFGASSGGYFLSLLATKIRFRSVILMIASGLFDSMDNVPNDYPPILFVYMPKDAKRSKRIDRHVKMLNEKGITVQEIKCMEIPLTRNWLDDRIPDIDQITSSKLFTLFREKGFINANGYLKNDGRLTPWRQALNESNIVLPYGSTFMDQVEEELNLAYAYHEMTSLQSDQIFEWLNVNIR